MFPISASASAKLTHRTSANSPLLWAMTPGSSTSSATTYTTRILVSGCTLRPITAVARTRSPVSSNVSRTAVSSCDSPGSIFPLGNVRGGVPSLRLPTRTPKWPVTIAAATAARAGTLADSVTPSILDPGTA